MAINKNEVMIQSYYLSSMNEWRASQVAQWVKNLPAMQEIPEFWVSFLGQKDPLEEGTATHYRILAWIITVLCLKLYQSSLQVFVRGGGQANRTLDTRWEMGGSLGRKDRLG